MNSGISFPITIILALVSLFVWTVGNKMQNKRLIYIGIFFSVAAILTLFLRL